MRCEECPSDMDEGLYERLREWRAVQAARSGQPAFCVFTDRTLMAIAETVPDEEGELARIPGVGVAQAQPVRIRCSGHLRRSGSGGGGRQ